MTDTPSTLSEWAHYYGSKGLEVFPVDPKTKAPLGELAPHAQKSASSDPSVIDHWWTARPDALIGCKVPEDLILLDIDPRNGGQETWSKLVEEHGDIPETRTHLSGRNDGGIHIWFRRPEAEKLSEAGFVAYANQHKIGEWVPPKREGDNGRWKSGIDLLRAEHRYTILPPSPHPDTGTPYLWGSTGGDIAECPPWVADLVTVADKKLVEEGRQPILLGGTDERPHGDDWDVERMGESVADWYSRTETWSHFLTGEGWEIVSGDGDSDGSKWKHPTATAAFSATIKNDCLFMYSPSTELTVTEVGAPAGYTLFRAYAALRHGDDMSSAYKALSELPGAPQRPAMSMNLDRHGLVSKTPDGLSDGNIEFALGGDFIFVLKTAQPAIWGQDDEVVWATGEPLMIAGGIGAGKTTLLGQLLRGRLGLGGDLLGYPIVPGNKTCLYFASDRPQQIARAFQRVYTKDERQLLDEKLRVWEGPPPVSFVDHPEALLEMARQADADSVFIDSLKDCAADLSSEATGLAINQAFQICVSNGVEVVLNHHARKASGDNKKPNKIDDLYGSTWVPAGCGSIIFLFGQPGDTELELIHLKQPASDIGPLRVAHDHDAGTTAVVTKQRARDWDPITWMENTNGPKTASDGARAMTGKMEPLDNDVRKVKRILNNLVDEGILYKDAGRMSGEGRLPTTYRLAYE